VERAITTNVSLVAAQDSDNILKTQTMAMPNVDIPQEMDTEGHTSGSGEGSMKHTFELMDTVPPTPHDSPLIGGYTPRSDEGRLKLKELMAICTKILKQIESFDDDLDEEDASKHERESDKTKSIPYLSLMKKTTAFMDEDLTIAQTLIKMKEEKAKEKGVAIKDVEDSPRTIRSITTMQPLPTIDPKDKGMGVLVEEDPEKPEKLAELDRAQKERQNQEEATSATLAEEFDEIQARIDADHELAVRLTHEEQEKEKWIDDFKPIDDNSQQQAESTKKRQRADSEKESSKKQKLEEDNDAEKEELRDSMDVVPRDDVAIDIESLATKYPIIDWKAHILNENMMYYQIIRADGSSKNYKIFNKMLDDFDRQDVIDLHRLVNERYETTSPEGYDLLLWGDMKTLFEPNKEDEIWKNQQDYNLISWRLFDSCGVHVLLMNIGVAIHMMIEKKYPLTQEMLLRMLNRRLDVDYESEMAFELLRFTKSQLQK
ncbi:hypothetical protein Tco_1197721, partial [Tanacetum coccineum]